MKVTKVVIVGSQGRHWTPRQRTEAVKRIRGILQSHIRSIHGPYGSYPNPRSVLLVSGGCGALGENRNQDFDGGVDVWAEIVADVLEIPKKIIYPDVHSWHDVTRGGKRLRGFYERNKSVAEEADIVYCIDPAWRDWSGGMWTLNYAKGLERETHLVLIE